MVCTWKTTIKFLKHHEEFSSRSNVKLFYNNVKPSTKKLVKLFRADPKNDSERDSYKYFLQYFRGLDDPNMTKLLQFLTGSNIILCENIDVSFIGTEGTFSRRPITHTCAPLLELPNSYRNFCELREEFQNVLKIDAWSMDSI